MDLKIFSQRDRRGERERGVGATRRNKNKLGTNKNRSFEMLFKRETER